MMSDALSLLYPRQTVLVTTRLEGKDNIITLDWSIPVSFKPPLLAISVAPQRHSFHRLKEAGEFVLAIPTPEMEEAALYCGTHSGRDTDKFKETGLTKEKAEKVNAPLIREAGANIECRIYESIEAGDHTMFIGEILKEHKKSDNVLMDLGHRKFTGIKRS